MTLLADKPARAALQRHEVDIPVVVSRSADLRPKPAPDQIIEACRLLGVCPSGTVMIGDSTRDAQAASRAGCRFVGVPATVAGRSRFPTGVASAPSLVSALRVADRM